MAMEELEKSEKLITRRGELFGILENISYSHLTRGSYRGGV